MISNEAQTGKEQLIGGKNDVAGYFIGVRRGEIEARLKPLEAQLKCERDGEKRLSLLIEHAELLKELCLLKNA